MLVSLLQENLLKSLTRGGRIVSPKAQLPVMQNALLSATNGQLLVTTTSLEITEVVQAGAKVEKEGGVCVSSRLLTELVSSLPTETVHLSSEKEALRVRCGAFQADIPGVATSEFPPTPELKGGSSTKFKKEQLLGALSRVLFAAATDEGRPLLTGVKITKKTEDLLIVATDGYRLSMSQPGTQTKEDLDLVIPARALSEVVKVGLEEKDEASIEMKKTEDGQLLFTVGGTFIYTRRIDGQYPEFEKIIPKTHTTRVLIDRELLARGVKSAAIFARDSANIVRFHIENQTLTVAANTPQVGENRIELEAKVDGEGGDIAFNARFLQDLLANSAGEDLLFEMTGSLNPGVFKLPKDDSFLHIIMPVRVNG